MFKELEKFLKLERLTVEEKIEADELLRKIRAKFADESIEVEDELNAKEVYVKEPDDLDAPLKYNKDDLNKMREVQVVLVAKSLGLKASIGDKKSDTIKAILEAQEKVAE